MLTSQNTQHSFIQQLEIHQAEDHPFDSLPDHVFITPKNLTHSYVKNEIFNRLLSCMSPTHPPNTQTDEMLAKYFTYNLNPIYEKISKLPQQIFVCGCCKEIYYGPSEYLLHCVESDCPINHNRSTYFFYFRSKLSQLKNSDVQKTLNEKELKELRQISYRKKKLIFSKIEVKPLGKNHQQFLICGKCDYKGSNTLRNINRNFVPHCILFCKSTKNAQNSHAFIHVQCRQDSTAFVDDIINLVVNFNVITLLNDSYVRIQNNPNSSNQSTYKHFCTNCKMNFSNETEFIQHCLFECKQKPNPKSSHLFSRKMVKLPLKIGKVQKNQLKNQANQNKNQQKKTQIRDKVEKGPKLAISEQKKRKKEQKSQKESIRKWDKQINPDFMDVKDFLENIYFCGQCLSHFVDEQSYLSHCFFNFCPLNIQRNSHLFFEKGSKEKLSMKTLDIFINESKIQQHSERLKDNPQLQRTITEYIQLVNAQTKEILRPGKSDHLHCGNCGQNFKKQFFFINHCLKVCYSENHTKNSHVIQYSKNSAVSDEQFKHFLKSYLYAIQILRYEPNKKYRVTKNEFIDVDPDFLCGKCDTLFENLYEYVLHSVSVCGNVRYKYSSHFLAHNFIRSKDEIQSPLEVVFGENLGANRWKNRRMNRIRIEEKKVNNLQAMEIETDKNQFTDRNENAKFQSFNNEKQENHVKEDKNEQNGLNLIGFYQRQRSQDDKNSIKPRFMRSNPDFEGDQNTRYYCGECKLVFRVQDDLMDHWRECQSFQNVQSSHFLMNNARYEEIMNEKIFEKRNYKFFCKLMPQFELKEYSDFVCGCGETGPIKRFVHHLRKCHDFEVVPGSSHVLLRLVFFRWTNQHLNIPLPVNLKGFKSDQKWVCPCKPWKRYSYDEFVMHIDKRHERRSPKLWMKLKVHNE